MDTWPVAAWSGVGQATLLSYLTLEKETLILSYMNKNSDADNALSEAAAARKRLAERIYTPWWYHPILGLLLGALVVQAGGVLGRPGMFLIPVTILGIFALGRIYRRLSGVDLYGSGSPDGGRRGRLLLAIYVLVLTVGFANVVVLSHVLGLGWTVWLFAILVAVGTIVIGRTYDGYLRAQLREAKS